MKNLLMFFLIIPSFLFAQNDSTKSAIGKDTVDIHEIVRKQMEAAKEKPAQTEAEIVKVPEVKLGIPANVQNTSVNENKILIVFNNMPMHIKLFLSFSVLILVAIVFRRTILSFGNKTKKTLKEKIAMIREEKVGSKENPKLRTSREKLRNNKILFNATDREISKAAKELKIAKGEFQLAARLKLFEVGKI